MQTNTPSIRSFAYKYGIIISIITIAFSLMIHFMDLTYSGSNLPQIVNYVVSAVCIIIAIVSFRSVNGGLLSVRQSVKLGTATALISGVVGVFYLLLFVNVIEPDFVEKIGTEVNAKKIAEKYPGLTSEEIQQAVDMQSQFFWVTYPFTLILSCLYGLFIGWITGLFSKIEHKKSSLTKNKIVSLGIAAAMVLSIFLPFFKIGKLNLFLLDILKAGESPESILLLILIIAFGVLTFMDKHLFARICSVIILLVLLYGAYNMADDQSILSQFDVDINIFKFLGLGAYLLLISSVLGVVFSKPDEK